MCEPPCPLGLRLTRGLFKREEDRERALGERKQGGLEIGKDEEPEDACRGASEAGTADTFHGEHKLEHGEDEKEKRCKVEAAIKEVYP